MIIKIGFVVSLLTIFFSGQAQKLDLIPASNTINLRFLNSNNGMSQNYVFAVCQDHQGFIWMGTINGLNKFDGQDFQTYYNNHDDSLSISNNNIRHMFTDREGELCISTAFGFDLYNCKKGTFTRYLSKEGNTQGLADNSCYTSAEDHEGNIWIGTWENYLHCLNRKTGKMIHYQLDVGNKSETINCLYIDDQDNIWAGTRGAGLFCLNHKSHKITHFMGPPGKEAVPEGNINQIFRDSKGRLFLLTAAGIRLFNPLTGKSVEVKVKTKDGVDPLTNHVIFSMAEDKNHLLWVGTEDGLVIMNAALTRCKRIVPSEENKHGLKNADVQFVFVDRTNNVWICTQEGVFVYNQFVNQFHYVDIAPPKLKTVASYSQTRIYQGKNGCIWVAQDEGYKKFSPVTGKVKSVSTHDILEHFPEDIAVSDSRQEYILPALNSDGLYIKSVKTGIVRHLVHEVNNPSSLSGNDVIEVYKDSEGRIWILTNSNGLDRYMPETGTFVSYLNNPNDSSSLSNNWLFDIQEDSRQNIWVATWSGLSRYIPDKNCFKRYLENSNILIFSITPCKDACFWLGTSNGLLKFNPATGKVVQSFDTKEGLPENLVHGVLTDSANSLWLSSTKGITHFDPVNLHATTYDESDGLQDKEFLRNAFLKTSDGTMYFGGINGINYFRPGQIRTDTNAAPVIISDFKIFNRSVTQYRDVKLNTVIGYAKSLSLSYKHYVISINYAALDYVNPQKCRYKYKLIGFDKYWNRVGHQQIATYTNLPHGSYIFEVKACNNQGVWDNTPTLLRINIKPPFWFTWWFIALMVLLFISILYAGYHFKVYLLKIKQHELEELVRLRTKELKDRNDRIEEQTEELKSHAESLRNTNELLVEKQQLIEEQTQTLLAKNEELSLLNLSKDKFFSIIAHDLRNPFHVVHGFTELLLNDYAKLPQEKIQRFLQLIYSASRNGNYLLENLLQWSRAQTGRINFEPSRFLFAPIAEETFKLFDSDIVRKNIVAHIHVDPDLAVYGDENMIRTVLRNLVSNAIKFTYEKGSITISALQHNFSMEISVADSGVGISKETQQLLFNVETNVTTQGTSHESGTGLGLILCWEFIEKHHGRIWIESELGRGAKFIFSLPLS